MSFWTSITYLFNIEACPKIVKKIGIGNQLFKSQVVDLNLRRQLNNLIPELSSGE